MNRLLGIAGWSGAGKTTLIAALIPALRGLGLRVSTIKHAHHGFEPDTPGKDSFVHRAAGAEEVLVVGGARWALFGQTEARAPEQLARRLAPVDLVLVEGFRAHAFDRLEVYRPALGKPPLWPEAAGIVAVASDAPIACNRPLLPLHAPGQIAAWIAAQWLPGHTEP